MARSAAAPVPAAPPAAHVAQTILREFGDRLHDKAICLTTPVPTLVSLKEVSPRGALRDFLVAYELRVAKSGLYAHQAKVVKALKKPKIPNVAMTTATGSGKSLAFWAWAFEILTRDEDATVIATFPTQALLWGQAKRLAQISDPGSLCAFKAVDGVHFGGIIELAGTEIPWTVWYGTTDCEYMKEHAASDDFANARLRICTLDKVHWSLMREEDSSFLGRLAGVIVDEAHSWHGLSGANVRAMFDRLRLSLDMLEKKHPQFFLASATLADPAAFAENLTGEPADSFLEVNDRGVAKAALVAAKDVPALLAKPRAPGLLRRYVYLITPDPSPLAARDILAEPKHLGANANALCFVQSKFVGHRLREHLSHELRDRDVVMYDGDLPPLERRTVENELFAPGGKAKVVVGTSALELGIDLPTLDLVIMDDLPPRRCDLLQRLGRVGRSSERPGLAVLCLGYAPGDERLLEEPLAAVAVEDVKPLPLPLHLERVRLQAMAAAFGEWMGRLKRKDASWVDFNVALKRYFDDDPHYPEFKKTLADELGDVADLDDGAWYYKGFRVSASQGKRSLILKGTKQVVAKIEDIAIFRDAHPEGIYLGHRGSSYRVDRYVGNWDVATWKSPGGVVLGKYMKGLKYILVIEAPPTLATRGRWQDSFTLADQRDLDKDCDEPSKGTLTFGVFTFLRKFDGYLEIDLLGRKKSKNVSLAAVAQRFSDAIDAGESFPFLHNFSYRTTGWKWLISRILDEKQRKLFAPVLGPLLQGFFCDAVECSRNDLQVSLHAEEGELRVVDGTPGGNGLSEAFLGDGRAAAAWAMAVKQVRAQGRRSEEHFRRYLAEECRVDVNVTAAEVVDAVKRLADAWNG